MIKNKEEKEAELENIRHNLGTASDRLGQKIDSGIKETVVYLQALGFNTTASCEGHIEHGLPWPWVDIAAENEPSERWVGQEQAFRNAAAKHNINLERLKHCEPEALYWEVIKNVVNNSEADDHKKWSVRNKKLATRLQRYLDEFYRSREVGPTLKLRIEKGNQIASRLQSFEEKDGNFEEYKDLASPMRKAEAKLLEAKKKEMKAFTYFLKKKYFRNKNG